MSSQENKWRDLSTLTIRELLGMLTVTQFWASVSSLVVLGASIFACGYWVRGLEEQAALGSRDLHAIASYVYQSIETERIDPVDGQIEVAPHSPTGSTVFIRLGAIPIPGSIRLQFGRNWGLLAAPPDSYETHANIVMVAAGVSKKEAEVLLAPDGVSAVYVPEAEQGDEPKKLLAKGDRIYAGETLLFDGIRTLWPSGGEGPFGRDAERQRPGQ